MCNLCLVEALPILDEARKGLNKRSELMETCRHQTKYLLKNWKRSKNK